MRRVVLSPLLKYLSGALLGMTVPHFGAAQEVKSLNLPTYPIEITDGSCTPESYSFLGEVIGGARVVALGEASHGTGTLTEHKQCIIAYLVEQQGFSVVAFEAFYTLMNRTNDYIHGEREDLAALLGEFSYSIYGTEEVYTFFAWAREHNLSHSAKEQLQVTDIDVQANQQTVEDVLAFVEYTDPAFLSRARSEYSDILALYSEGRVSDVTNAHIQSAKTVADHLASQRETYLQTYSEEGIQHALRSANVTFQHLMTASDNARDGRDELMAENLLALLEGDNKVIFWAHMGHVRESDSPFVAAGTRLAEALGDDYFSVAMTFGEGKNRRLIRDRQDSSDCVEGNYTEEQKRYPKGYLPNCIERVPPPLQGSLEAFLLEMSLANTFLDLRVEENLPAPLAKSIPMRGLGRTSQAEAYRFTDLGEYDALIFLKEVSAATDLQAGDPFTDDRETNP